MGEWLGPGQCLTEQGRTCGHEPALASAAAGSSLGTAVARKGPSAFREDSARGVFLLLSKPLLCKMGLSSSKAHPRVTKVAPMLAKEDLPALTAPYRLPGTPGEPSLHTSAMAEWGIPTFHRQLPPLRETWYGRASSGKGVFNKLLRSAGQRPAGAPAGAAGLQRRVGLCVCQYAAVAFCLFQDILALGKT